MIDVEQLRQWVGKTKSATDMISLNICRGMEALLDRPPLLRKGDPLPPLWHWLYFHEIAKQSALGRDGHPKKGDFLPPVPLPRRMWAGGRFEFGAPVVIGADCEKQSTIKSIEAKSGRSGALCFVGVEHQHIVDGTCAFREEHDIVYREDPKPGDAPIPSVIARENPEFSQIITPTSVMLFRYSALTFNGHRIHYDRDYCRDVEAYPGLVFHGPLTATLLLQMGLEHAGERELKAFDFRAVSPLFDVAPFELRGWQNGSEIELQAVNPQGGLAMRAVAAFC